MERKGNKIFLEKVAVSTLAEVYGTPLYAYEAGRIRDNYRRLEKVFRTRWEKFRIFYAIKANSNPHIIRLLMEEGAGCDCASRNEIVLARKLGAKGEAILFSGNFLSDEDLEAGLKNKVILNLDDVSLLPRLLRFGTPSVLSFRINPGIGKSNVHDSDVMAGRQAKFGIPWEQAEAAYAQAKAAGIRRFGVHMMTGSCVTDPFYFETITEKLLDIVGPVIRKLGLSPEFVDIGGGFGIPYHPGEKPLDLKKTARLVTRVFRRKTAEYGMGKPWLFVEPGRYLVGDAGFVIGRVHAVKQGYKKFVGTDVGMNILARPVLYGAWHGIFVEKTGRRKAEKQKARKETVTITGQACENADAWGKDRKLPGIETGDLVVVENAGAYGYVMSYPYNGRLRPAEVLVEGKKHRLIRKRETAQNWLASVV